MIFFFWTKNPNLNKKKFNKEFTGGLGGWGEGGLGGGGLSASDFFLTKNPHL